MPFFADRPRVRRKRATLGALPRAGKFVRRARQCSSSGTVLEGLEERRIIGGCPLIRVRPVTKSR